MKQERKKDERTLTDDRHFHLDRHILTQSQILDGILGSMPLAVFRISADGHFTEVLGRGVERLGVTQEFLVGKHVLECFPQVAGELEAALNGRAVVCETSGTLEGEAWWFRNYLFPDNVLHDGVIGVCLDITEVKRAEAQKSDLERSLARNDRLRSMSILAGGIAHDFSNTLMGILGSASVALDALQQKADPALLSALLAEIKRAATRASDVCKSMAAYAGDMSFEPETFDVVALARERVALAEPPVKQLRAPKFCITSDSDVNGAGDVLVNADKKQVALMIDQLVRNATESFSGPTVQKNACINIRLGRLQASRDDLRGGYVDDHLEPGRYVFIEVSDNGAGMSANMMQLIFDPFFSTKFSGRGLGLAAVMTSVREHRGTISCSSQVGMGTCFRVLLPEFAAIQPREPGKKDQRHLAHHPMLNARSMQSGTKALTPQKVLVVDDDDISRTIIGRMLRSAGYEVITAEDGEAGLRVFHENEADIQLVVLDIIMPKLSGDEALIEIRKRNQRVPVLLSSAYGAKRALDLSDPSSGPVAFLRKPYRYEDLVEKLKELQ